MNAPMEEQKRKSLVSALGHLDAEAEREIKYWQTFIVVEPKTPDFPESRDRVKGFLVQYSFGSRKFRMSSEQVLRMISQQIEHGFESETIRVELMSFLVVVENKLRALQTIQEFAVATWGSAYR